MKDFYVRLYKATAIACQSEIDPNSFPPYAWRKLTKVWSALIDKEWHPFYVVLHELFWGVYPHKYIPRRFQPLLDVVKEILLSSNTIASAWHHTEAFEWAMEKVMDGRCGENCFDSMEHVFYLEAHLRQSLHLEDDAEDYNDIIDQLEGYRGTICALIPQACEWDAKTWGEVTNIFKGLDAQYGTEYEKNGYEYDNLIYMLKYFTTETMIWSMSYISVFSLELAKKIWPEDTEAILNGLFVNAVENTKKYIADGRPLDDEASDYRYPTGVFDFNKLRSSWLFQYVGERIKNDIYPDNHPVKRAYFDVVFSS